MRPTAHMPSLELGPSITHPMDRRALAPRGRS